MPSTIATATGVSSSITLTPGEWALQFTSAGAFVLDVQVSSPDGGSFFDLYYDAATKVTINSSSGPRHVAVVGEMTYRMDVNTYNNPITMRAVKVS